MIELSLLAVIAAYSFALGRRVLQYAGFEFATWAGHVAACTALGLGALAYLVFGLGLVGLLNLPTVLLATGAAIVVVWISGWIRSVKYSVLSTQHSVARAGPNPVCVEWSRSMLRKLKAVARRFAGESTDGAGRLRSAVAVAREYLRAVDLLRLFQFGLVGIALAGTLVCALAPPTAGDALCYHLEIPKRFVQMGEVRFLPLTDNSVMPFLMEMLYMLALLFGSPELAQLLHWLIGALLALVAAELAAPIVGKRGAVWAAIIVLLVPGVTNQMTAPLNDLAVGLFATLLVQAWVRWTDTRQWRWLALAGVWGGLGMSVKLVAAAMVASVVATLAVVEWRRRGRAAAARAVLILSLCLSLTGGAWYARSWYHTGNPVYPYFNAFFGGAPHTASLLRTDYGLLEAPWAATMHPEAFGGRGVQFGAVFLALLPGLLIVRRPAGLQPLLILALGYSVLWFVFRQDLRFLLPVVPILATAAVTVVLGLREVHRPAFVAACACVAGLLVFQSLIVVKRARPCVAVAVGRETREAYLARHEPSYAVARYVNSTLPADCRVISQDYRGFYFRPDFVREAAMLRRAPYAERGDELVDQLVASGFTHVLLVQSYNPESAVYDQSFTERLGGAAERLPVVLDSHFDGPNGDRRDYKLLELPRAGSPKHAADIGPRAAKGIAN